MKIDAHAHIWGPELDSAQNLEMIEGCHRFETVSYTHLDVYKRQPHRLKAIQR